MIAIVLDARMGYCPRCCQFVTWRKLRETDRETRKPVDFWHSQHDVTTPRRLGSDGRFRPAMTLACWYFQASEPSATVLGSLVEASP